MANALLITGSAGVTIDSDVGPVAALASSAHAAGGTTRKNGFLAFAIRSLAIGGYHVEGRRIYSLSYDPGDLTDARSSSALGCADIQLASAHVDAELDRGGLLAIPTDLSDKDAIPDAWVGVH